jgi:hypothetical protein
MMSLGATKAALAGTDSFSARFTLPPALVEWKQDAYAAAHGMSQKTQFMLTPYCDIL